MIILLPRLHSTCTWC